MNLAEIELTAEQAQAFLHLLDERAAMMRVMRAQAEEKQEQMRHDGRRHERLRELATRTARMHGKLIGIDLQLQAEAAWNTFIANEGWFSTYDVDEHWSDRDGFDWEETWTLAYAAEVERMLRESIAPCNPGDA